MNALLKLAAPLAVVAILLAHFSLGALAGEVVTLTNVTGSAADCARPVVNAACATLFPGDESMWPGEAPSTATVTLTYHGPHESGSLGLYLSRFVSRSPLSAPYCTALDPADKLDIGITQDSVTLYSGTLSALARDHGEPAQLLDVPAGPALRPGRWPPGATSSFTISVGLDLSADNAYMGCVSTTDFVWSAE